MEHKERLHVAGRIATLLNESYGPSILAVVLDGSTARGDDTAYSDLELRVITSERLRTRTMPESGYVEGAYRNLAVQLQFLQEKEVYQMISHPTPEWPMRVWTFLEPTLVLPSANAERTMEGFKKAYRNVRPESFRPAIRWSLVWVWEMYGKVRSTNERGSSDWIWVAPSLAHNAALLVSLVNHKYFHYGDSRYLTELSLFPHLPNRFIPLFKELQSGEAGLIPRAAKGMWESCSTFAKRQGLPSAADASWRGFVRTMGISS